MRLTKKPESTVTGSSFCSIFLFDLVTVIGKSCAKEGREKRGQRCRGFGIEFGRWAIHLRGESNLYSQIQQCASARPVYPKPSLLCPYAALGNPWTLLRLSTVVSLNTLEDALMATQDLESHLISIFQPIRARLIVSGLCCLRFCLSTGE